MGNDKNEPAFNILPHPAKTNDPNDLKGPPQAGGGLQNNDNAAAYHAKGPYVPNEEQLKSMGEPASREELRKRAEELNK